MGSALAGWPVAHIALAGLAAVTVVIATLTVLAVAFTRWETAHLTRTSRPTPPPQTGGTWWTPSSWR